jgi:hypothetical protein
MRDESIWIPFIVFFSIFGYLAFRRYLEYRETVALAEKGLVKPREGGDGKDSLRWGIVLASLGLALCIGTYPIAWMVDGRFGPFGFGPWLLPGLLLLFFGLGLILIYLVTKKPDAPPSAPEPTWVSAPSAPPAEPYPSSPSYPAPSPAPLPPVEPAAPEPSAAPPDTSL